jgi:single-stranded-DNA-specific exonuclease
VQHAVVAPQYRWKLRGESSAGLRRRFETEHQLHPLAAAVLSQRGILPENAAAFLQPSLRELPEPEQLPGFAAARAAFEGAVVRNELVLLHGDYDADGLCGAVLMKMLAEHLGLRTESFVPDRVSDGYSFGPRSLAAIEACGAKLVIAVDNGTTAFAPLAQLAERGVSVLVVDHHPPAAELPRCTALVNPWLAPRAGAGAIFPHFCGTATAWLLAWGILRGRHGSGTQPPAARKFLNDTLGLVALATVADVMPLTGPNRALVAAGLRVLADSGLPGLRALVSSSGIRGAPTAQDLAFKVAPRLNAAGRLGRAELSFRLLATSSAAEAQRLCAELEALNLERRQIQERENLRLQPEVSEQVRAGHGLIFAGHRAGHFGVLGVVAGQVQESTGLPTLLWAECEPGLARGSARAPQGADLVELLAGAREHLSGFGGHARAAGFHFDPARAEEIGQALRRTAAALPPPGQPILDIDGEISPGESDLQAALALTRLAPYGEAFPEPVFLCAGARLSADARPLGGGGHAELRLEREGASIRALAWRGLQRFGDLRTGDRVDLAVSLGVNDFRGQRRVEWTVRDLCSSNA